MPVFRIERTRDYTVMSNHHLKNQKLSLKAKGLLSMMLSFPDEWNYSERGLAAICKEGVDAIHSAIKELENARYMERHQLRGPGGRIVDTEYVIFEKPRELNMPPPDPEDPHPDSSETAEPGMVIPVESSTQKSSTQQTSTQELKIQSFTPHHNDSGEDRLTDGSEQLMEIREQIEYKSLREQFRKEQLDELVELMLEVQMNQGKMIRFGQNNEYPTSYVQGRFAKIGREHIEKVLDGVNENTTAVKNTRSYLMSALFNSVSTLDNHYTMLVNHDFYGK